MHTHLQFFLFFCTPYTYILRKWLLARQDICELFCTVWRIHTSFSISPLLLRESRCKKWRIHTCFYVSPLLLRELRCKKWRIHISFNLSPLLSRECRVTLQEMKDERRRRSDQKLSYNHSILLFLKSRFHIID